MIPSKEEVEKMDMAGAWYHFNQRLNERYSLDITLDEYMALRHEPMQVFRNESHKKVGVMKIKGTEVVVVKEKHRKRKLITALPFKNAFTPKPDKS